MDISRRDSFRLVAALPLLAYSQDRRIILREEWGARDPTSDPHLVLYTPFHDFDVSLLDIFGVMGCFDTNMLEWLAVHHSGPGASIATVQQIQEAHMNNGKSDIAYNWVIDREGMIYEGRFWFVMGAAVGASFESRSQIEEHGRLVDPSLSPNYGVLNICLIGDFTKGEPTVAQKDSLYWLSGFVARNFVSIEKERVIGHKQAYLIAQERGVTLVPECETLCPGSIEEVLDGVRQRFGEEKSYKPERDLRDYEMHFDFRERSAIRFS